MKILFSLMLVIIFISCGKNKYDNCYHCKITSGTYYRELDTCSDVTADKYKFVTPDPLNQTVICKER
jgi:hypothetical protein